MGIGPYVDVPTRRPTDLLTQSMTDVGRVESRLNTFQLEATNRLRRLKELKHKHEFVNKFEGNLDAVVHSYDIGISTHGCHPPMQPPSTKPTQAVSKFLDAIRTQRTHVSGQPTADIPPTHSSTTASTNIRNTLTADCAWTSTQEDIIETLLLSTPHLPPTSKELPTEVLQQRSPTSAQSEIRQIMCHYESVVEQMQLEIRSLTERLCTAEKISSQLSLGMQVRWPSEPGLDGFVLLCGISYDHNIHASFERLI